jgi:DNA-binding transcriptional regulator/RsmH inhibitor MraZ
MYTGCDVLWTSHPDEALRMAWEAGEGRYIRGISDGRFKIQPKFRDPLRLDREIVWVGEKQVLCIYSRETWDALQRTDG